MYFCWISLSQEQASETSSDQSQHEHFQRFKKQTGLNITSCCMNQAELLQINPTVTKGKDDLFQSVCLLETQKAVDGLFMHGSHGESTTTSFSSNMQSQLVSVKWNHNSFFCESDGSKHTCRPCKSNLTKKQR